jgi:hypothetical protein
MFAVELGILWKQSWTNFKYYPKNFTRGTDTSQRHFECYADALIASCKWWKIIKNYEYGVATNSVLIWKVDQLVKND